MHAEAIKLAKGLGSRVHVFEEGYLRPCWVNYERGGANGNSRLMGMTVAQMQKVLRKARIDLTEASAHWGDKICRVKTDSALASTFYDKRRQSWRVS